jgi:hypothetical protein
VRRGVAASGLAPEIGKPRRSYPRTSRCQNRRPAGQFSSNLYVGDLDRGGQSHKSLIAAFEQSLRTDYIDLYWLCN